MSPRCSRVIAPLLLLAALAAAPQEAPANGTLTIRKALTVGSGPYAGAFRFSGSWGEEFELVAGGQSEFVLPGGTYSFSESPVAGFLFVGTSCAGPAGASSFAQPAATVEVVDGSTTTCTSTSTPEINIGVDPESAGSARMRARHRCRPRPRLVAWVRAGNARSVSFSVNGRWVKTIRRPTAGNLFRLSTRAGRGRLRVSAVVRFVAGSTPQETRVTKVLGPCPRSPAFAGSRP